MRTGSMNLKQAVEPSADCADGADSGSADRLSRHLPEVNSPRPASFRSPALPSAKSVKSADPIGSSRKTSAVLLGALLAAALPAAANIVTEPTQTWSVGYTVGDDGNTAGPFGIEVAGSAIQAITRLEVGLSFSGVPQSADDPGGFAGDLVVTLARVLDVGGTPVITTSHLLNRIGVGTVSGERSASTMVQ